MTYPNDELSLAQIVSNLSQSDKSSSHSRIWQGGGRKRRDPPGPNKPASARANFVARSEPRNSQASFTSAGLSLYVGQLIRKSNREEMWESLIVRCDEETDGTLAIRVIVSNPDWDRLIQIAYIRSRPGDVDFRTALACNLDHEELRG